jgi:hypothetical protein
VVSVDLSRSFQPRHWSRPIGLQRRAFSPRHGWCVTSSSAMTRRGGSPSDTSATGLDVERSGTLTVGLSPVVSSTTRRSRGQSWPARCCCCRLTPGSQRLEQRRHRTLPERRPCPLLTSRRPLLLSRRVRYLSRRPPPRRPSPFDRSRLHRFPLRHPSPARRSPRHRSPARQQPPLHHSPRRRPVRPLARRVTGRPCCAVCPLTLVEMPQDHHR